MTSWLLYITAGRIEIYPQMKYQLPIINRSWDSTLAKQILTGLWTDWRTYGKPEPSMPLEGQGPGGITTSQLTKTEHLAERKNN